LCLIGFTICALIVSFCRPGAVRSRPLRSIVRKATSILTILLLGALMFNPIQATTVTEYLIPGNPGLWDLSVNGTSTNGGVVVFTESASNNVGYLFLSNSSVRQIPVPTPNSFPMGITLVPSTGPNSWTNATHSVSAVFTESYGNKIGVMANNNTRRIAEYAVPTPGSGLRKIVYDPIRNVVWFTEYAAGKLGNFCFTVTSPSVHGGRFGELLLPGAGADSNPIGIAIGTNLTAPENGRPYIWVADFGRKSIVRVWPEKGACRSYYVDPFSPWDVAVDADGFVWFTAQRLGTNVNVIGRLDPVAYEQNKWALTLFSIPTPNCEVRDIEIDRKGNIWFTEYSDYASKIGRYSPLTNTFSEYQIITSTAKPQGLAIYTETGGTVNVWFTEYAGRRIGRIRQPEGPTVSTTVYSISSAVTTSSTATTTFNGTRPMTTGVSTVYYPTTPSTATNTTATTTSSTIADTLSVVVTSSTYWTLTYTYTTSTSWTTTTTTYTLTTASLETTSTTTSTTFTQVSTSWESVTTLTTATVVSISWFSETTSTTTSATEVSTIFSPTVTVPTTTTTRTTTTAYSPTVTLTSTSLTGTTTTTTSTTATTTTSYSPTVTLTSTTTSFTTFLPIRPCIIASAAYGSELAPEVQSLRTFRDWRVLSTFAGTRFMKAFNAFYYSFSPTVASTVASSPIATALVRILLYPLIWILQVSSMIFDTLAFAPELGMVTAGLFAGALLGIVYVAPPVVGARCLIKRRRDARRALVRARFWRLVQR